MSSEPSFRRALYFGVCIPIRLVILFFLATHPVLAGAVAKIAALVFLVMGGWRDAGQWWSRSMLTVMAIIILFIPVEHIKYVFLTSILVGLSQALVVDFC